MNTSLYLSQSYQDSWSDYQRSLKTPSFPVWDYIILTASNEHQAECFRLQIDARKDFLPEKTKIVIIPDEGGVRVGSGGATLSVLKYLRQHEPSFEGLRVLVLHSGGDSKRVPQYSALGKLFSPVPHRLPDGRSSTLFDELLIAMSAVPGRIHEGMLLLAGDVLLLFNPLLIDWSGRGAAAISFKEDVNTGKNHGVFLRGSDGNVRSFLHKQSVDTLREVGAVNDSNAVDIDTGAILFGVDLLGSLWSLISSGDVLDEDKYRAFVNDKVRLSLYGDFEYPLAADSTLSDFYEEKPEGEYSHELHDCRTALWNALRSYRLKLLRLAPAKFIHFGTTGEILKLMGFGLSDYKDLGWSRIVNSSAENCAGYNSVSDPGAEIGEGTYLEVSYVHGDAKVGKNCILSYIDIRDEVIPDNVVLHGLKQSDGKFVARIYGVDDNPKENKLFGKELTGDLWKEGDSHTLWNACIYPEKDTIREAVESALEIYRIVTGDGSFSGDSTTDGDEPSRTNSVAGNLLPRGKSMAAGFHDADPEAILKWNEHMEELVAMNEVYRLIDNHIPAEQAELPASLSRVQRQWLNGKLLKADFSEAMRLHYYIGTALKDETEVFKAFSVLQSAILDSTLKELKENEDARIVLDEHTVNLPLRVNFGGGWSDTPPYCNENGGTVLNAAILINGNRPVKVTLKKLPEHKIVFESSDMDVHGEFDSIEPLQSVGDPFDPFVLQKAALLACGVIPKEGGDLETVLTRLGGGIYMDTEVTGVPKGSGLGTSSILAAACVKALFEFLGISHSEDDLYSHVLAMEQIMSTGGGWQDQVGGVTDGIKYITSKPGLSQLLRVEHLSLDPDTMDELNRRFTLIYTGQRRLARNLLRDVVGRYIGNAPDTVFALDEIQKNATLQRFELERGNIDAFAELLNRHWELSKMIDAGSTNTLINQIFDSCDDLLAGKMICGAGGGGFLQVVLKSGVSKEELQRRLKSVFYDTTIGVWDCTLV
ncbi:MAG: bifunctional fucokinase/L-fucose-1-P-guanylyltransferase [Lachnospiraceae bacterium]|nr:bifunctional fucokinase/L-fucose-1-P-guanylyltransferase [Lachnospiraceae bacterium]